MKITSDIKISSVISDNFIRAHANGSQLALRWLGQAGFQIFYRGHHLMIDPYLSDHLAKKYAGKEFPHIRMMSSPLELSNITDLNFILSTHRHSDHMDPEALPILLKNNPACKFVAPKAERQHIKNIITDTEKTILVNAYDKLDLATDISLDVIPSAHETLKTDVDGNHHYLGYILRLGNVSIYHSGDCVPYPDLKQELKKRKIDIALLPVNGRDEQRRSKGVPGNFTFDEALDICHEAKIPFLIPHHFGMFDFNTIARSELKNVRYPDINVFVPEVYFMYVLDTLYN